MRRKIKKQTKISADSIYNSNLKHLQLEYNFVPIKKKREENQLAEKSDLSLIAEVFNVKVKDTKHINLGTEVSNNKEHSNQKKKKRRRIHIVDNHVTNEFSNEIKINSQKNAIEKATAPLILNKKSVTQQPLNKKVPNCIKNRTGINVQYYKKPLRKIEDVVTEPPQNLKTYTKKFNKMYLNFIDKNIESKDDDQYIQNSKINLKDVENARQAYEILKQKRALSRNNKSKLIQI